MASRKEELIEATINIVAENGLENFSMRQVTNKVGVSEALVYKHFGNKDNLLFSCYEAYEEELLSLFNDIQPPDVTKPGARDEFVKGLWMKYYDYLIKNGNKTIFFFAYRDSTYSEYIARLDNDSQQTHFKQFISNIGKCLDMSMIANKIYHSVLWTFILDTTCVFAKRVLRGELDDTQELREMIWKLIYSGFSWVM